MSETQETLDAVLELQKNHELSILKLSEPISRTHKSSSSERTSDVSLDAFDNPTPASLEADLTHYKELFSKLRFSYLEQVTKEKFIRSIVGDPPLVVEHAENVELEATLAHSKAALKAQKTEVAELVSELEKRGRELCIKHQDIQLQTSQLGELPLTISNLERSIEELKAAQKSSSSNPLMNMSLDKTLAMVHEKEKERAELERQIEQLQSLVPRKTKELERLHAEVQPLEVKRAGSVAAAKEARRRKEEALGGVGDDLEERGRWWRGVEGGLKGMLEIEGK